MKITNLKTVPQAGAGIHSLIHSLIHPSPPGFLPLTSILNMPGLGSDPRVRTGLHIYSRRTCSQRGPQGPEIVPNGMTPAADINAWSPPGTRNPRVPSTSTPIFSASHKRKSRSSSGMKSTQNMKFEATQNKPRTAESQDWWGLLGPGDSGGKKTLQTPLMVSKA